MARATLAEQLREAIGDAKRTNYKLAADSGVAEATIWRFRKGTIDLRTETIDRLLDALELEVSIRRRGRSKGAK